MIKTKQTNKSIRQQTLVKAESAVWQVSECLSYVLRMQACVLLDTACCWAWLRQLPIHCILATAVIFQSCVRQMVILTVIRGVASVLGNHRHGTENEPPVSWISLKEEKRGTGCHFPFQQAKMSRPFHKAPQRFLLQVVCVCQSGPHSQLPEEVSS